MNRIMPCTAAHPPLGGEVLTVDEVDVGTGHSFVDTERYMGLFHEVAPSEYALQCADCHYGATRMDFNSLGYTPNTEYNGKPLCASCHEDQSGKWTGTEYFTRVHQKHVEDKHIDCISCHGFSSVY